jgi:Dolichyl-phosphate-mannose-protein mannosyltransferase
VQLIHRFRIPALFCALTVLLCELISRPYANMGVCDDWSYVRTAQELAASGHIHYNGWAAPMLGWQLYLGAAFVRLFGFSFTTVRMSTLFVAMLMAFALQRTLVRAGISECNATLGTLALALSPLYLMLSVTFMSDIFGLFAIVLCLYGCLRALQSTNDRTTIAWLLFAIAANALFGTSRQIAWLGTLVMVPSTLWLLRSQRRVLFGGAAAVLAGGLFIFACLTWLSHQPYSIPEHLLPKPFRPLRIILELTHAFLDIPFLLLPIVALFLPQLRKSRPRVIAAISSLLLGYLLLAIYAHFSYPLFVLTPTLPDWVGVHGIFETMSLRGTPPIFLPRSVQVLLTIASIGGLLCLIASLFRSHGTLSAAATTSSRISWEQLSVLLAPFASAYALLLVPQAITDGVFDRYLLGLLLVGLLCLVRYYQDRIHPRLPLASVLLVGIMAVYAIAVTHNLFALYRARIALAAEIRSAGTPDASVDNGWEYDSWFELQHTDHINNPKIIFPAHAYVKIPRPPAPDGACQVWWYPHIQPLYGISFDPNACNGPAPFAPVHYSRWPYRTPGTLYVVNYIAPTKP